MYFGNIVAWTAQLGRMALPRQSKWREVWPPSPMSLVRQYVGTRAAKDGIDIVLLAHDIELEPPTSWKFLGFDVDKF